jgi:hypothetical protein
MSGRGSIGRNKMDPANRDLERDTPTIRGNLQLPGGQRTNALFTPFSIPGYAPSEYRAFSMPCLGCTYPIIPG